MTVSRIIYMIGLFALVTGSACLAADKEPDASAFTSYASRFLPIEKRYDYHRTLGKGPVHRLYRDPAVQPSTEEMSISPEGWTLVIRSDAGALLRRSAEDFRDYLQTSMQVRVSLKLQDSLDGWSALGKVIVAGMSDQMPGIGDELKGSKDYEIRASADRIVVCGFDDRGVMFGLYNLEERMNLREGPFLPNDLKTVRHSLYQTRMALSWLGWMEWPDAYLSHLAHDGFDAIYASVYANPNGVEGPSHYRLIRRQNPARLHDLIKRAGRYGIKVYAPILYSATGQPDNEAGLRELVRDIVTKFPDIYGYILLTEGFQYKSFFGAGGHGKTDLRDWAKHWTRAVQIVAEECHQINPKIEILPWEYNIDFRPNQAELKRYVMSLLPKETIPLLTWENGKGFEIDGFQGYLRDYSISQVGPAEVTEAQIAEVKRRDMRVYSKADAFGTWQFGTIPYLPCPYQWYRRYDALAKAGVNGTLETWSNGYKPNFVAELRAWSSWTDAPPLDALLRSIARRAFGAGSEDLALKAWDHFSQAIQLVPDTGPSMGTNFAVANPLFFQQPPPRTMLLRHSWWDENKWKHSILGHKLNPYWPYTHVRMVFYPDFTNRRNQAEIYAGRWSGISGIDNQDQLKRTSILSVFNKYLLLAADGLEEGLKSYRRAAMGAPESKRIGACKEVMVAEQMQRMLRSNQAILEFEDLRFRLSKIKEPDEASPVLDRMTAILAAEIERTEGSLAAAQRDSRLGYEFEQDYVYTPYVLEEKLDVLRETLEQQIPAYRKQHK